MSSARQNSLKLYYTILLLLLYYTILCHTVLYNTGLFGAECDFDCDCVNGACDAAAGACICDDNDDAGHWGGMHCERCAAEWTARGPGG